MRKLVVVAAVVLSMACVAGAQDVAKAPVVIEKVPARPKWPIRVAVYDDKGSPRTPADFARVFGGAPEKYALTNVTAEDIRKGVLKDFDVIVQGGGGAHSQSEQLQAEGREQIRSFVKAGGGYLGICAGAYLASSSSSAYLHLLNARVVDSAHWARGRGNVELGFTTVGLAETNTKDPKPTVMYHQGPLLAPADEPSLPAYTEVAKFDTEVAEKGAPHGVMPGTTALASGQFGEGRVFVISPHPEQTEGQEPMVRGALEWVTKRR